MRSSSTANRSIRADWIAVILLSVSGVTAGLFTAVFMWGSSDEVAQSSSPYVSLLPLGVSLVIALLAVWASKLLVEEAHRHAEQQLELWKLNSELTYAQRARELHHDLVNHLSAVSALIQVGATKRATEYLHRILDTNRRTDETPDTARGETFTLLLGMLGQKLARAKQEGVSLGIEIDTGWEATDVTDEVAVRILGNLTDNALDAAAQGEERPDDRRVEISVTMRNGTCRFRVWNNGPTIPESAMERIFSAGETSKGEGHQGLGLYIVKQLVREHQGYVDVRSDPENGTEFVITFSSKASRAG